ncbi:MAG: GNAT family N-acetyltransferase [Bacilli bacterium]
MGLETERLILRTLDMNDAKTVQQLAGDFDIANTTLHVPHPYPDGAAETWIERVRTFTEEGRGYTFAIILKSDDIFMGVISLGLAQAHGRAELAYWLGKPYWGQGYTTEAAHRVVEFGFGKLNLHRIFAFAMTKNPASSRVMQKIGMSYEGTLVHHVRKWEEYEDLVVYGMVKADGDERLL